MNILGTWDVRIRTPIGSIEVVYTFTDTGGGRVKGTARSKQETVEVQDVVIDGQRITWRQTITRPLRLNLDFVVVVDDTELAGHSRAGRLPRSTVTGTRREPRDPPRE